MGLICPRCQHENSGVLATRARERGKRINRRRECDNCGHRFTTNERIDLVSTIKGMMNNLDMDTSILPTYKPRDRHVSVLVGGSNRNGNDQEKQRIITAFLELGFEVHHTCDIFTAYKDETAGNEAVVRCLSQVDYYYVIASANGYTGNATAAKFSYAKYACPALELISSQELADPDLAFYIDRILGIEAFIEHVYHNKLVNGNIDSSAATSAIEVARP